MFDLPPFDPGIEIIAASQGMSKGLRQTEGAQIVVRPELASGPFFVGAQYRNLDSPFAGGELWGVAGLRGQAGGFALAAGITYKRWIATTGRPDRDAVELNGSVAREIGPLTPRIALYYSPDDLGANRASLYFEGGAALRIAPGTDLLAYAGRRKRGNGPDYAAFNAGISHAFLRHFTAELRYYDTSRGGIDETYRRRLIASLRLRF